VSAPESMDAMGALGLVGLDDRDRVRAALAATLVKRAADRPRFDLLFDRFFGVLAAPPPPSADGDAGPADGRGEGFGGLFDDPADAEQRLEAALREVGSPSSPLQVGLRALRALDALEAPRRVAARAAAAGSARAEAEGEALAATVRDRLRGMLEARDPARTARSRAERIGRTPLLALPAEEVEEALAEARRFGAALRERMERRRRRAPRGRLDTRATTRRAAGSGGVPFDPVFRRRHRRRPELAVLVDVSDSVREAARFFLVLVHAMQRAFGRTRSFLFVREVAESTALFDAHPAAEAVARAYRGELLPVGAGSDYGHALDRFLRQHGDALTPRTTLVVLGDGRTNRLDPRLDRLAELRRRTRRIVWLNPEAESSWGLGDSEMLAYRRFCAAAFSVRTLDELRRATEALSRLAT
jgi:uncharacterized protein with von Willebrand factor type A (vWA) domain